MRFRSRVVATAGTVVEMFLSDVPFVVGLREPFAVQRIAARGFKVDARRVRVSARGQVAWVNSEGMAGIMLQTLRGKGGEQLNAWLAAREKMELKETTAEE